MAGFDKFYLNANLATMAGSDAPYGAIKNGALGVTDGRISWIGLAEALPGIADELATEVINLDNRWLTPGLIDCHTHIVFGGNRAEEFAERLKGVSYEEIARRGGGIMSTVRQTRELDEEGLFEAARPRVEGLIAEGVTTLEIKSGYGLTSSSEICMLKAARRLGRELPIRIETSFLGAHALPEEYQGRADAYLDYIIETMLPTIAQDGLADAVDAFLENIAFDADQVRHLFEAAKFLGLPVKLHADQLSNMQGAALAAEFGALSADHLEYTDRKGVRSMARAGTVAVLLPGAFYTLGGEQKPPIELFRKEGVPMAIASDSNPGSSPMLSLRLAMNMASRLFGLTAEESLLGVTRHAAAALGLGSELGTLEVGKAADFAIWNIRDPAELSYWLGGNLLHDRVLAGLSDRRN